MKYKKRKNEESKTPISIRFLQEIKWNERIKKRQEKKQKMKKEKIRKAQKKKDKETKKEDCNFVRKTKNCNLINKFQK